MERSYQFIILWLFIIVFFILNLLPDGISSYESKEMIRGKVLRAVVLNVNNYFFAKIFISLNV